MGDTSYAVFDDEDDDEDGPEWNDGYPNRGEVLRRAKQMIGTPFRWGGSGPGGFDADGLVQWVYGKSYKDMPRRMSGQMHFGDRVPLEDLDAGDLVVWKKSRHDGRPHIAISIGNGKIIEAPRPGLAVQISELTDKDSAFGVAVRSGSNDPPEEGEDNDASRRGRPSAAGVAQAEEAPPGAPRGAA